MTIPKKILFTLLAIMIVAATLFATPALAGKRPLTIAVASNALAPIKKIARAFEEKNRTKISVVSGSTGKLFTQITQGAPFDILIAADELRPRLLEERGLTRKGSRFTYASGVLVMWSLTQDGPLKDDTTLKVLTDPTIGRVAIANPDIAPYGHAALEALRAEGILEEVRSKFIYGENVSHAFNFARTGNADIAIIFFLFMDLLNSLRASYADSPTSILLATSICGFLTRSFE